jgi:hypothetical protein
VPKSLKNEGKAYQISGIDGIGDEMFCIVKTIVYTSVLLE